MEEEDYDSEDDESFKSGGSPQESGDDEDGSDEEDPDGDVSMEEDSIDKDELAFVKKSGSIVEGKRARPSRAAAGDKGKNKNWLVDMRI